jgi:LmbE family N-acetylglucosaminyl deacetylase
MEHASPAVQGALTDFASLISAADGDDRSSELIVVAAHPDDETVGLGGHLLRLPQTTIVHVTDGAPRDLADARANGFDNWQAYADARRRELEAAMAIAGIAGGSLIALDFPDQQAAYSMASLARRLTWLFEAEEARFVCTHPFEGGHPDHDATAFAVYAACRLMQRDGRIAPHIIEFACYHAGPDGPVFQNFATQPSAISMEAPLDPQALAAKRCMLACHATQRRTLAPFTASVERFRTAPAYDFRKLPNGGHLLCETLPVGFRGSEWRALVEHALFELGLEET